MNKVILMGRLTRDPEVRYSQGDNATAIARFTLAVDRRIKRDNEASVDYINCVSFGRSAEFAEKYFHKGTKIVIAGRIQTGSYTNKDGQKVYTTDIVIEEQDFAERKVIDYYVIYDIKESSKYKPTIVNEYVDNIILGTGEYKCEYEILLSCSDATRRVVIPVRTINVPMYDFINSIEDEIEDVMDRCSEENVFNNIIIDTGDYFLLDMFDEYGRTYKVEITGVYDFIKMIVSIRQIRCEFFPYEKK